MTPRPRGLRGGRRLLGPDAPGLRGRRPEALVLALLLSGCTVCLSEVCPRCPELLPERPPRLSPEVERVYVLVPGILGYGWEWNGAQIALAAVPRSAVLVLDWTPWGSLAAGAERVRLGTQRLLRQLAGGTGRELIILGHSVGGLLVALAAAELQVPPTVRVRAIVIGAPFAGTHLTLFDWPGSLHAPSPFAVGGTFASWPEPAPGVSLHVYPTAWPGDPVMKPRLGHDPARQGSLPRRAMVHRLPQGMDHNVAVGWIAARLAQEALGSAAPGPGAGRSGR